MHLNKNLHLVKVELGLVRWQTQIDQLPNLFCELTNRNLSDDKCGLSATNQIHENNRTCQPTNPQISADSCALSVHKAYLSAAESRMDLPQEQNLHLNTLTCNGGGDRQHESKKAVTPRAN